MAYNGGNIEHRLPHASHSTNSRWCCCCGTGLFLVESEVLLLQLVAAVSKQDLELGGKNPVLPNYFTAADGTKRKKTKNGTLEVWMVLHGKHASTHESTRGALQHEHDDDHPSMSTGCTRARAQGGQAISATVNRILNGMRNSSDIFLTCTWV